MEQAQTDWREDIGEPAGTFKVADGESKVVRFLDEGTKKVHPEFGESIVFKVEFQGQKLDWHINPNNFSLLKQLKDIGSLKGIVKKVNRVGSRKTDTRYTLSNL